MGLNNVSFTKLCFSTRSISYLTKNPDLRIIEFVIVDLNLYKIHLASGIFIAEDSF